MPKEKFDKVIHSIGDFFDVLSHPDRIKIVGLLKDTEMDVNQLRDALEISQSRTSQHLRLLKLNGIVTERKEGKHVFYKLKNKNIIKVVQTALQFQLIAFSTEPETISMISDLLMTWHI